MSGIRVAGANVLRSLELAWSDDEAREKLLTATERYALDPLALLEDGHVWIYDRDTKRPIRFRPFDTQVESLLAWIDVDHLRATGTPAYRNVVEEKSRQMGATWIYAYGLLWGVTYHDGAGLVSHLRASEVDDGGERNTWRSIFGKIRYMHRRLPDGSKVDAAGEPITVGRAALRFYPGARDPAKIVNLGRESVIYGEPATSNPGRGGTYDRVLADEFAFVPFGEKAYAALDEACPTGKVLLSTVNGDDNAHARRADERPKGWIYLRHHWSQHPQRREGLHLAGGLPDAQPTPAMSEAAAACALCAGNRIGLHWIAADPRAHRYPGKLTSPWYDSRIVGKTDEQVAQELDIDREGALSGRVYAEWRTEAHVVHAIDFEPTLPVELAFDYGIDCTAVLVCQDAPAEYRVIGEVELVDGPGITVTPERVVSALLEELAGLGIPRPLLTPYWTRQILAHGDPAGDARQLATGEPLVADYSRLGFTIHPPPRYLTRRVDPSIRAVKRLMLGWPKPLRVASRCERFAEHARNNRWPVDAQGKRRVGATRPLDDRHNHMMRAFAYLIVSKFPPPAEEDPLDAPGPDTDGSEARQERRSFVDGSRPTFVYGSTL